MNLTFVSFKENAIHPETGMVNTDSYRPASSVVQHQYIDSINNNTMYSLGHISIQFSTLYTQISNNHIFSPLWSHILIRGWIWQREPREGVIWNMKFLHSIVLLQSFNHFHSALIKQYFISREQLYLSEQYKYLCFFPESHTNTPCMSLTVTLFLDNRQWFHG